MPQAKLRVRQTMMPLRTARPWLRRAAVTTLIAALAIGGGRWLLQPPGAGAVEFTPRTVAALGSAKGVRGVAIAKINSDSRKDIIVAGQFGIRVYGNLGSFRFKRYIMEDKDAERVQAVDLNGDGKLDILATFKGSSPSVRWYENRDNFDFAAHDFDPTGSDAVAYAGDIDGDTSADVVTAGSEGGNIVLRRWMNNGGGDFTATTLNSDSKVTAVTIGDLNDNGYKDIVTGGEAGLQRWDTTNGSTWSRSDIDDGNTNRTYLTIGAGDDSGTWIASANDSTDEVLLYRSGQGDSFMNYGRLVIDEQVDAKTTAITDLDGDGNVDVLVAATDDNALYWYKGDGNGAFTKTTLASSLQSVYGVAVADIGGNSNLDFVAGDHFRGAIYAYERIHSKPVATSPGEISQSVAGTGRIVFTTTVSSPERQTTRLKVEYSLDGKTWYKPWLADIQTDKGTADLKNSNEYQIGTSNAIDTDTNDEVKLTIAWDTKAAGNGAGLLTGDRESVRVRLTPWEAKATGDKAQSPAFRVDNQAPTGLGNFHFVAIGATQAELEWDRPLDSGTFTAAIYYGTDNAAVQEERSSVWGSEQQATMGDVENTSATITGLTADQLYVFKLVVTDKFGNRAVAPSVQGVMNASGVLPTASPGFVPVTPLPAVSLVPSASPSSGPVEWPEALASPSPPAISAAPIVRHNRAPVGSAGPDQVVNPRALVILDGTGSFDPDPGDTAAMLYNWRQLSGPPVALISERTATASFSAGGENETYIFALTVRDANGASAMDTVTIATKALPAGDNIAVVVASPAPEPKAEAAEPGLIRNVLKPLDILLFVLSLGSLLILLGERAAHALKGGKYKSANAGSARSLSQGKVVHYRTGEPIAGAQVLIYGQDGKLRATERTTEQGFFATFFPAGQYTLDVRAEGFAFGPTTVKFAAPSDSIIYTGGQLNVKDANQPLPIIVPLKPTAGEVSSLNAQFLHVWQTTQRLGRALSWPLFLTGAGLNTLLVFFSPRLLYLVIEIMYVLLIIVKVVLEVRVKPAYGQVRDAITHVPLDLAVVRLFEQGTNRLVMTRVTNNQGKFFALPPSGIYTITVSKPGYANFSRDNLEIKSEHDTTLQMIADLMPVVPQGGGLAQARAAVL